MNTQSTPQSPQLGGGFFKKLWMSLWAVIKPVLIKIGHIQAWLILSIIYVVLIAPLGFLVSRISDLLGIKRRSVNSFWVDKYQDPKIDQSSRRQY